MEATIEKPLPTIDASALDAAPPAAAPAQPGTAVATAPGAVLDLTKFDLSKVALAGFAECEEQIKVAEETLKDVVHDLSTPTKLKDAISLRNRLVKTPRTNIGKLGDAIRARMRKVGTDVKEHEEKLASEFDRVELYITPQIEARQAEIAADEQRETDRKARHTDAIAKIAGMLTGAEDKSAERLAKGIEIVDGLLIEGFEEFQAEAEATRTRVLLALKALHQKAVDREAAAKLLAAQTLALEIGQRVTDLIGQPADAIRNALNLLELTSYPEDMDLSVLRAHGAALVQLRAMLAAAEKAAADAAELEKLRAAQVPAPVPPAPAPEPAPADPIGDALRALPVLGTLVSAGGPGSGVFSFAAAPPAPVEPLQAATHIEMRPGVMVKIHEPDTRPPISTGALNERFGPGFTMTAQFINALGFQATERPAGVKSGVYWRACDFEEICDALTRHVASVRGAA